MAITKERKQKLVEEYVGILAKSKGVIVTEYRGMTMKQLSDLRAKLRENDSALTITKNTLFKLALHEVGMAVPEDLFVGPVAVITAFDDLSKTIKAVLDHADTTDIFVVKGGVIGTSAVHGDELEAISNLPPIEALRAQLLGAISMPLAQFVGLLNEPGRQVVAVIQAGTNGLVNVLAAYSQKDAA